MLACELSTSIDCARLSVLGRASMLTAVTRFAATLRTYSGSMRGASTPMTSCPEWRCLRSSSFGRLTVNKRSPDERQRSRSAMVAPVFVYASSVSHAPSPAPVSTVTSRPIAPSFATSSGTSATRLSPRSVSRRTAAIRCFDAEVETSPSSSPCCSLGCASSGIAHLPFAARATCPSRSIAASSFAFPRSCGPVQTEPSDQLRNHLDCAARALCDAYPTAFAVVVVERIAIPRAELRHGVIWTDAVAIVALEAVATRKAAPRLVERVRLVETAHDLFEPVLTPDEFELALHGARGIRVVPGVQVLKRRQLLKRRQPVAIRARWFHLAQPLINPPGGFLSVTDGDSGRPFRGDHVATCKDSRKTRHHAVVDDNGAVFDLDAFDARKR